jgi:hypothetical protein
MKIKKYHLQKVRERHEALRQGDEESVVHLDGKRKRQIR